MVSNNHAKENTVKMKSKYLLVTILLLFVIGAFCSCQAPDESCAHEWQAATCTAPATCSLCGEMQGEANGHTYSESISAQPSCEADGTKLYTCTACDDSYTKPLDKLGHTVANGICNQCYQIIKGGSIMQEKSPICSYTTECSNESGAEALYIYIPTGEGYIRYQLVHTVHTRRNADTWRLGYVAHVDDAFENAVTITNPGAEWEMALELEGRVDFIGGLAHGDEIFSSLKLTSDGKEFAAKKINFLPFDTFTVEVESTCYDPNAAGRHVFDHYKKLIFSADGVRVEQRVEFKTDEVPKRVYLGMMPPQKECTDYYYTNLDDTRKELPNQKGIYRHERAEGLNSVTLLGNSGFTFTMTVEKYNEGEHDFMISDNSGNNYNKMYFAYLADHISAGDVWETVTLYKITYKES